MKALKWLLSITTALILLQTLFFKFTAHPDSVYIFTKIGMEPWGRIGSGITELLAAILILIPTTRVYGALLSTMVISGAIFFHLATLGIAVQGDSTLFYLALLVFICSTVLLILERNILLSHVKKRL